MKIIKILMKEINEIKDNINKKVKMKKKKINILEKNIMN